jgi:hypothetical protein
MIITTEHIELFELLAWEFREFPDRDSYREVEEFILQTVSSGEMDDDLLRLCLQKRRKFYDGTSKDSL